jgi:diketogulonate reductase-like aldo/keto reductase
MALEAGFRDVDTASHYGTEAAVGAAVRDAVARGVVASAAAVRVTTKVRRAFQKDLLLERLMDRCCWRKK